MAQKSNMTVSGAYTRFPKEAYDYNDDVRTEVVEEIRRERGIEASAEEWEVVDGFGQVVYA